MALILSNGTCPGHDRSAALFASRPAFPKPWSIELHRNAAGRAWWCVSRFVSKSRVEYVTGPDGSHKWFRTEREAMAECKRQNEANRAL